MSRIDLNQKLATDAQMTATAARELMAWVSDPANEPVVGKQSSELSKLLRKESITARRLYESSQRKMCAAVFGPSQAGKSYLVSSLATDVSSALRITYGEKQYDFLTELNPGGNRESTALVTRFGTQLASNREGFPVRARLLSQTDIVKILGNTFFSDFDQNRRVFDPLDAKQIEERLEDLRKKANPAPTDTLTADDVFDVGEYFTLHFRGPTIELQSGFWDEALNLAPLLTAEHRAQLWSVIWSDFEPFTKLYLDLYRGLRQLQFVSEVDLPIAALVPRESSIIDVLVLDRLGTDSADVIAVRFSAETGGTEARLPRSLMCALTAELSAPLSRKPSELFDTTDLLDFPGARSRLKITDLSEANAGNKEANPLRELYLRGKVAYLFQRYTAERELSSVVLCIPDGPQEVKDLSAMVKEWIDYTIGKLPSERRSQACSLLLVLTKMDVEFENKAGETEASSRERWTARLTNSLLKNFPEGWATDWDGYPFNNVYWLRSPGYKLDGRIDYQDDREVGLVPAFAAHLSRLRERFLSNEVVARHFKDPAKAWDEALKLNDGGVTYLASRLMALCDDETKRHQLSQQLDAVKGSLVSLTERFHVSGNLAERVAQRASSADSIVGQLYDEGARLGLLLRGLQLEAVSLREHLYRTMVRGEIKVSPIDLMRPTLPRPGGSLGSANLPMPGKPRPISETPQQSQSWSARATECAMTFWLRTMNEAAQNESFCRKVGVDGGAVRDIGAELQLAARRIGLPALIEKAIEEVRYQDSDLGIAKAAIVTQHHINRFVSELGMERVPLNERPAVEGTPIFAPRPPAYSIANWPVRRLDFRSAFLVSWAFGFHALVLKNAESESGLRVDPAQNDRLGRVLSALRGN